MMMVLILLTLPTYLLSFEEASQPMNVRLRLRSGLKAQRNARSSIRTAETNSAESTSVDDKAAAKVEVWDRALATGPHSYLFHKDCCGLPFGARQKQLLQIFSSVSDPRDIQTPGTPQYKAFNWIKEEDEYCLCPDNASCELVQRYVMAVFYFSTGGEKWVNCGAKSSVCDPSGTTYNGFPTSSCFDGASERWLAPVSSCRWCGNICDDMNHNTCITQIDIGKDLLAVLGGLL